METIIMHGETRKLKYTRIYEDLMRAISYGEYKPFESIPTEEELCRIYSVSRRTVATAVNMLVKNRMVRRVRGKGTFVVHDDTTLPKQKLPLVGVVVPSGPKFNHTQVIVDNIIMQGELRNFKPVVNRPNSPENMRELLLYLSADIKYFLVYLYSSSPILGDVIRELQEKNIRLVLINFRRTDVETDYVIPDFEKAAYIATEHLIKKGRKKIAYLTQPRLNEQYMHVNALDEHFSGYKKALDDYGREFDSRLVAEEIFGNTCPPEFFSGNVYVAYLAARQLFAHQKGISGLVTFNDMEALGALIALEELGIKVPDDISVVGFGDDNELHAYFSLKNIECTLTTVSAHRQKVMLHTAPPLYD